LGAPGSERPIDVILGYLDASTGSLLVQLLVGGAAGILAFARLRWGSLKGWLNRGSKDN
jgi:hypothetical protein